MKQISIILADDHPLMQKLICDFLIQKEYKILDTAIDGKQAFQLIEKWQPDIAILDNQMPFYSGLDVAKLCAKNNLSTKIILVTFGNESLTKNSMHDFNIAGYVLKEHALEELEECIESVLKNNRYFSQKLTSISTDKLIDTIELNTLTPSEKKILKLIAKNFTEDDIAKKLLINRQLLETYCDKICKKINVHSPLQLKNWAIKNQQDIV